ncbi:MAG TPA: hypothetical protein VNJ02_09505 [Vicinamibacterales bacterium]|nr:hypothetical protein [Vicinamibacterales bacterium]
MNARSRQNLGTVTLVIGITAVTLASLAAQTPAKPARPAQKAATPWSVARTPDGKPDLQGNWSNETQTPLERMGKDSALTPEQAAALEERARVVEEFRDKPSDPNRPPPVKGGDTKSLTPPGQPSFVELIAQGAGGAVGGYNGFWLDPGNNVIRIDGVARSSIVIDPPNGRLPALTAAGKQRLSERAAAARKFGEFDHPEMRPLSDRCLVSFGANAGPPMLPNYFYNNNYQIVQTKDHVMILTEMVNDARIIRLGVNEHLPRHVQPWFGDSIGRWEGDTLVVETTNIHPQQLAQTSILWPYRGASTDLKVTERFTRTGPDTILYRFTMEDPSTFTAPFTGELPFNRINEQLFEYACHEANYAMTNILSGERMKEKEKAASKKQ